MTHIISVSPDFMPDKISGWFLFNTWLQRLSKEAFHLELYDGFAAQRKDIEAGKIDMIYANPFDASMLIRDKGFIPLVCPTGKSDETTIAVPANSSVGEVEDFQAGLKIATTDDPDVHLMGMIMLEPAELDANNTERLTKDNYVLVAKALLRGEADAGFFLTESFEELSSMVRSELKEVISSKISVIHHVVMLAPSLAARADQFREIFLNMSSDEKGAKILAELGFTGWQEVSQEDAEFMIDLMDTLLSKQA